MGANIGRVVIITRPTEYDQLVISHGHAMAASFALENQGRKLSWYKAQHDRHQASVHTVAKLVPKDLPMCHLKRDNIGTFPFRANDLVIACGPDGLFANIAKYLNGQLVITVDTDPETNDGKLMWHKAQDACERMLTVIGDKPFATADIPLLSAKTERTKGGVLAVNDLLIGRLDQMSARYALTVGSSTENQSLSGILISTGVGSTGGLSSIANMVKSIAGTAGKLSNGMEQEAKEFVYVVREPFVSRDTQASLVFGFLHGSQTLVVESRMATGGVIVSDGMIGDPVLFDAGERVTVSLSSRSVILVK
jgi:NAD kinase